LGNSTREETGKRERERERIEGKRDDGTARVHDSRAVVILSIPVPLY